MISERRKGLDFAKLEEAYRPFREELIKRNFFEQGVEETFAAIRGFRLIRPKSRSYQEPGEMCFVYVPPLKQIVEGNDYRVVVCSTKRREGWVGKDSAWVIIVDRSGEKLYSKGPFVRRSPAVFDRVLKEAKVARWRVYYRPNECPKGCRAPMLLVHEIGRLKSQYWRCAVCPNDRSHNRRFDDIRKPLPPDVMEERLRGRRQRSKERKKMREAGKDPFAAFKLRMKHPWKKVPIDSPLLF